VGIVIREPNALEFQVAEAYDGVKVVEFSEFAKKTKKTEKLKFLRPKEFRDLAKETLKEFRHRLVMLLKGTYLGLPYDKDFTLTNDGIYCSELVLKLLNPFLKDKIPTKPMHFKKNRKAWEEYFRGRVPDGAQGISPGDLEKSNLFIEL